MGKVWKRSSSQGGIQALAQLHQGVKVKLVSVTLPVNFLHDVLVIVISQSPAHLVVVHVGLGLPLAPPAGHLVGVGHLELARGALPGDEGDGGRVRQELEEKLPKLDLSGWLDGGWARCRVTAAYFCNMIRIKRLKYNSVFRKSFKYSLQYVKSAFQIPR